MSETVLVDLKKRMQGAIESFSKDLSGIRTGRASTNFLDPVMVEAYGAHMPLTQVATVNVPSPQLLTVQVWDQAMAKAVEKAIREAGLGVNPSIDGQVIRVPMPELTEERRQELVKIARKYAEAARVAIRNVRRDGMESLKKLEKENQLSKDDHHRFSEQIQKMTDEFITKVDTLIETKEKDISQV